jgi:hypothetical protein
MEDNSTHEKEFEIKICEFIYLLQEFNLNLFKFLLWFTYNLVKQWFLFLIKTLMKFIREFITWGVTTRCYIYIKKSCKKANSGHVIPY